MTDIFGELSFCMLRTFILESVSIFIYKFFIKEKLFLYPFHFISRKIIEIPQCFVINDSIYKYMVQLVLHKNNTEKVFNTINVESRN